MYDSRTTHCRQVLQRVVEAFGDKVYQTVITKTVKFPESTVAGAPITTLDPASSGARNYRQLAREVIAAHDERPAVAAHVLWALAQPAAMAGLRGRVPARRRAARRRCGWPRAACGSAAAPARCCPAGRTSTRSARSPRCSAAPAGVAPTVPTAARSAAARRSARRAGLAVLVASQVGVRRLPGAYPDVSAGRCARPPVRRAARRSRADCRRAAHAVGRGRPALLRAAGAAADAAAGRVRLLWLQLAPGAAAAAAVLARQRRRRVVLLPSCCVCRAATAAASCWIDAVGRPVLRVLGVTWRELPFVPWLIPATDAARDPAVASLPPGRRPSAGSPCGWPTSPARSTCCCS